MSERETVPEGKLGDGGVERSVGTTAPIVARKTDSPSATPAPAPEQLLTAQHRHMLEKESGIDPAVIAERGYRSALRWQDIMGLGFSSAQNRPECFPALLIPQYAPSGEPTHHLLRYDNPRHGRDGKVIKYEHPRSFPLRIDVPPRCHDGLWSPTATLWITEGSKKADALASRGLIAVSIPGVDGWQKADATLDLIGVPFKEKSGKDEIPRSVVLAFDSDVITKPPVRFALMRLAKWTKLRGADVRVIDWTNAKLPDGTKVGVDDFLTAHNVDDLQELISPFDEWIQKTKAEWDRKRPYRWHPDDGIEYLRLDKDGKPDGTPLTNFVAMIAADIAENDGAEVRRTFEIRTYLHGQVSTFRVPAEKFASLGWVTEHMGADAILYAGTGTKEHARAAIQLLSGHIPKRAVFTHLGWTKVDGQYFYLHASGGIGADGPADDVEVAITEPLNSYQLPDPPAGQELIRCVRASLEILEVAPANTTTPLFAAVFRAPIGDVDHSIFLEGSTGTGKSALAALVQQFYGSSMDGRHLPASWSSTGNALELLAFLAKDALMTVDDFVHSGSLQDRARLNAGADRLLRGQGNRAGRQRMTAEAALRPGRPPRGLILSTGEDSPAGESLKSRMLILELAPGDTDWDRLSRCQREADKGTYAKVLSGFIRWLAPRYEQVRAALPERIAAFRAAAYGGNVHRRVPEIVANLAIGLSCFLEFGRDIGAFTAEECERRWKTWWPALIAPARNQAQFQASAEPARRFLTLLAAALASGHAHVTSSTGSEPENPEALGWRRRPSYAGEERLPQGQWVGWIDGEDLYLQPEASYNAVYSFGQKSGEAFAVTSTTLNKRLYEQGFLASTERENRRVLTVRRRYNGEQIRRDWLHLSSSALYPAKNADLADPADPGATPPWKLLNEAENGSAFSDSGSASGSAFEGHSGASPRDSFTENNKRLYSSYSASKSWVGKVGSVGKNNGGTSRVDDLALGSPSCGSANPTQASRHDSIADPTSPSEPNFDAFPSSKPSFDTREPLYEEDEDQEEGEV